MSKEASKARWVTPRYLKWQQAHTEAFLCSVSRLSHQVYVTMPWGLVSLLALVFPSLFSTRNKIFFLGHGTSRLTEHFNALSVSYCQSHDLWNALLTLFGRVLPLSSSQARTLVVCRDRDNPSTGVWSSLDLQTQQQLINIALTAVYFIGFF